MSGFGRRLHFIEALATYQKRGSGLDQLPSVTIIADSLDRAAFFGLFAAGFLLRAFRLFVNQGITAVVVSLEIIGSSLAAQIAVDALVIDIILACDVLRISICHVSHKISSRTANMASDAHNRKDNWDCAWKRGHWERSREKAARGSAPYTDF